MDNTQDSLSSEELDLIRELRAEVLTIKDCIAKYAIQCLAFVTAALGALLTVQVTAENAAIIGLAAVLALLVLRAVSRTAVHKLGTINRNLGYEMHLNRTRRLSESGGWQHEYRSVGWEEAMRAWRIVQSSVFEALCHDASGWFGMGQYRPEYRKLAWEPPEPGKDPPYLWYDVRYLVAAATAPELTRSERLFLNIKAFVGWPRPNAPATYHAGSYVRKMLVIMHRAMLACLVPQFIAFYHVFVSVDGAAARSDLGTMLATLILPAATFVWIRVSMKRDAVRLDQLESGILSIHSCAVLWQAVVVAHFRALSAWKRSRESSFPEPALSAGYTYNLAVQAADLAEDPLRIHQWIKDGRRDRRMKVDLPGELILKDESLVPARVVNLSSTSLRESAPKRRGAATSRQREPTVERDDLRFPGVGVDVTGLDAIAPDAITGLRIGASERRFDVIWSTRHFSARDQGGKTSDRRGLSIQIRDSEWKAFVGSVASSGA